MVSINITIYALHDYGDKKSFGLCKYWYKSLLRFIAFLLATPLFEGKSS